MIGMGHRRIRHLATRKESRAAREDVMRKMGRGGNPILKISPCEKKERRQIKRQMGKQDHHSLH